jgi:hypothetical protein
MNMPATKSALTPDENMVLALASAAIFWGACPDGLPGRHDAEDPDCRWPAENAARAVKLDEFATLTEKQRNEPLDSHTVFEHALELGILLGARIAANPLQRPEVVDLFERCRASFARSV